MYTRVSADVLDHSFIFNASIIDKNRDDFLNILFIYLFVAIMAAGTHTFYCEIENGNAFYLNVCCNY